MSKPLPPPTGAQIIGLYRRFSRLKLALKSAKLDAYSFRYQINANYPPPLRDIIHLNTETIGNCTYPVGKKGGYVENTAFHGILLGWKSTRFGLVKTLDKMVPLFFRNTLHNPHHPIYAESAGHHERLNGLIREAKTKGQKGIQNGQNGKDGKDGKNAENTVLFSGLFETTPAQPLSQKQLYQLGVRTLYFLERALGLRPYVCYVEYGANVVSHGENILSNTNAHPSNQLSLFLRSANRQKHGNNNQNAVQSSFGPSARVVLNEGLGGAESTNQNLVSSALKNPNLASSFSSFSLKSQNLTSTPSPQDLFRYTGIRNNRQRVIKNVIPLSNNPRSLDLIPERHQVVLYTIHQYFSTIEKNLGPGLKLTGEQKRAILQQLDPQYKELLTNCFIVNPNHRLEERLLQCINKGNYFTIGFQNTVPLIIQRYQLISLLKELQLIIL